MQRPCHVVEQLAGVPSRLQTHAGLLGEFGSLPSETPAFRKAPTTQEEQPVMWLTQPQWRRLTDGPLPGSPQGLAVSVTVTAMSEGSRRT